ncbi:hypothetical protein FAI40_06515 [Acetobacteraceae bacterium]|nr:hypothetical protein FAI40_06515 [Acetobacteraceae bacterium]
MDRDEFARKVGEFVRNGAQKAGEFAHKVDDGLIDGVFQPIMDRLLPGKSPWRLGLNFQLGSLVFLGFAFFILLIIGAVSLALNFYNLLSFVFGLVLFLGFSRMHIVERSGMGNPMRPALFVWRVLFLISSFYDVYQILYDRSLLALPNDLQYMSDIAFGIGLYFMACRVAPPRQKRRTIEAYSWQESQ